MNGQFRKGQRIQWRKDSAFYDNQGEWVDGVFDRQSERCVFIADSTGKIAEYWAHKIEIRSVMNDTDETRVKDTENGRITARIIGLNVVELIGYKSAAPYQTYLSRFLDGSPNGFTYDGRFHCWRDMRILTDDLQ